MGFGIRHAVDKETANLEIRAYLGVPFGYLESIDDYEIDKARESIFKNFNSVFDVFPGVANKFLSGTPYIKLFSEKDTETLYLVLSGYRVLKVDRLDEFLDFFCKVIMEEVCRRSLFDISFSINRLMPEFEDLNGKV